jgi:hypothetical protein
VPAAAVGIERSAETAAYRAIAASVPESGVIGLIGAGAAVVAFLFRKRKEERAARVELRPPIQGIFRQQIRNISRVSARYC